MTARIHASDVTAVVINDARGEMENVVIRNTDNGAYGEWTIKNVTLTTNGEFRCMAVNNNGRMMQPITGQFVIMDLTIMAHIAARTIG